MNAQVLSSSFATFSMPDKSEGFDDIEWIWQQEEAAKEYLGKWVKDRKRNMKIEDLQPGQWFQDTVRAWQRDFTLLQTKQEGGPVSEEPPAAAAAASVEEAEEKDPEQQALAEAKAKATGVIDIHTVEDITDVGTGEPLFKSFGFSDWALFQLRYELYLLQKAFAKDVEDPERPGIVEQHLMFYYNKYFRKQLSPKHFGVNTIQELLDMVKDSITLEDGVLSTPLQEDVELPLFCKHTEERRRERQRRIDAGDESARLKLTAMAMQQPAPLTTAAKAPMAAKWGAAPASKAWADGKGGGYGGPAAWAAGYGGGAWRGYEGKKGGGKAWGRW